MKTYIIFASKSGNSYWYGWFEGLESAWSNWYTSVESALEAELYSDNEEESLEDFRKRSNNELRIIYESSEPIDFETFQRKYPEVFI